MYIETKKYPAMVGEPHLGSIEESELIEDVNEGTNLFFDTWSDDSMVCMTVTTPDDMTGEPIKLKAVDYFTMEDIIMFKGYLDDKYEAGIKVTPQVLQRIHKGF